MPKRTSAEALLDYEEPDLRIVVADREEPLLAHRSVLRLFCRCVRDLPGGADGGTTAWDLRQLVLEGESAPVGGDVVQCYLDLVYRRVDVERRFEAPASLGEARPLVMFADAVGSSAAVCEQLEQSLLDASGLCLVVRCDEDSGVGLRLRGRLYVLSMEHGLQEWTVPRDGGVKILLQANGARLASRHAAIQAAVSSAIEEWLYLAGRTHMMRLMRLLLDFTKLQMIAADLGVLSAEGVQGVCSPRVLQCMPRELLLEAFVRDILTDLPSRLTLQCQEASARLATPADASFLPLAAGAGVATSVKLEPYNNGDSVVRMPGASGGFARLQLRHGGYGPQTRAAVIKAVLYQAQQSS
ncbi:hypothetical protein GPECTOR_67g276 [Gonium pectorale]|uniref:Uncharacterized protein n=1 Tax=Gonium pectorale TaxID=33097 RepID=A0A150G3I2_GONPE|nr:hypothetical protein GPECTOR_67g276 [Gonium pectorale]|eukprot:KXZ44436.1 hypothetical protein GPECTOR_67g276 [Gonium pectorale]